MKKIAGLILAATAWLSACGGGGGSSDSPADVSPSAVTASDSQAILAAPTQVTVNGISISATAWLPSGNAQPDGHAVPSDQQSAYVELRASNTIDWSTVQLHGFAKTVSGQAQVMNTAVASVRPSAGNDRVAYLFIGNQMGQQSLALKVAIGGQTAQWLRLQDNHCGYTHPVSTSRGLFCGVNGPAMPGVFMQHDDFSGTAAIVQSMLYRDDGVTTEADAMNGMMTYGETDKIKARGGFSLLDVKRYFVARGYVIGGYKMTTRQHYFDMLSQADMGLIVMMPIDGYLYTLWLTAADDSYVYLASPHFGNLAVPWGSIPAELIALLVAHPSATH